MRRRHLRRGGGEPSKCPGKSIPGKGNRVLDWDRLGLVLEQLEACSCGRGGREVESGPGAIQREMRIPRALGAIARTHARNEKAAAAGV